MAVRVLCLHGYAGNAARLRTQLLPLLPAFGDAELVYLAAPVVPADAHVVDGLRNFLGERKPA
jgi:hypothetical protein